MNSDILLHKFIFCRHIEQLKKKNLLGGITMHIIAIIKHLAKYPVRDPVAIIQHFWNSIQAWECTTTDNHDEMLKIYQIFILLELKFNLFAYGGTQAGFPNSNLTMIELGRSALLDGVNMEE